MSTMRVTNLKHELSASNNIVLNSDGSVGGDLATTLASKLDLAGGKILQVVRAIDSTSRSTTSTSYVDVTGVSVTITPSINTSALLLLCFFRLGTPSGGSSLLQITDSSNNAISGSEETAFTDMLNVSSVIAAYATPASTSALTYKLRFKSSGGTTFLVNNLQTAQIYAIEVSA